MTTQGHGPPAASPGGPARDRILVVDDELGVREGCRKILAAEGYEVVTAGDGTAGLEQLVERGPFSVLLVDLQMPRLSGLELMREARQRDPDVLPIIITAHATIDSAVEGTRQGAYSYIPKPFTPDELLLSIRNGLERRALSLEARRLRADRERRMLELASERSRSTTILAAMMDGILVINSERLVVLRNNAAARIMPDCAAKETPFPLDQVASPDVREIVDVVLGTPGNAPGAPTDAPGAPGGFMILSRQITLGQSTFMVNVSPVLEPDGSLSGAVAVFSDVTEMKKLDTAKSMFVSLVAHEVKSPLAASEGWLTLVLSGVLKQDAAEERRMLERAQLRLRTLRGLVNEILSLTAMQTGTFALKRVPVDAAAVVAEVVENERGKAVERKITITVEREEEQVRLLADREALGMIYGNLVENAVKYSRDGGCVIVRLRRDGIYAALSVTDRGIGIAPADREKIFDEFYRVRGENTAAIPGTGLGLSLVKRLAELHQGTVSVTSTLGEGSEFTVRIPLA